MRLARLVLVLALLALVVGVERASADDPHVVVNVVNGFVYVSLGARDGASAGDRVEVVDGPGIVGVLDLDLCGEVVCRAKLPDGLQTEIVRGMLVRTRANQAAASAPAAAAAAPSPSVAMRPVPAPTPVARHDDALPDPDRPVMLPYRSGQPVPAGYRVVRRTNDTLVRGGWALLGVGYGVSLLAALVDRSNGVVLLLPVAGPFVYAASDERKELGTEWSVALGVAQVVGVGMLIGAARGSDVLWRDDVKVTLAPVITRDVAAVGLVARF